MNLELERKEFYPDRCIGGLYIDGTYFCYTLEDTDRKLEEDGIKIPKQTAIPRGKYKVIINHSNRFKRDMPLLLDVPQFEGIRIHAGNTPENTEGCILLGMEYDAPTHEIRKSRIAFDEVFIMLEESLDEEDCWIEVR